MKAGRRTWDHYKYSAAPLFSHPSHTPLLHHHLSSRSRHFSERSRVRGFSIFVCFQKKRLGFRVQGGKAHKTHNRGRYTANVQTRTEVTAHPCAQTLNMRHAHRAFEESCCCSVWICAFKSLIYKHGRHTWHLLLKFFDERVCLYLRVQLLPGIFYLFIYFIYFIYYIFYFIFYFTFYVLASRCSTATLLVSARTAASWHWKRKS